jgi:hypothetical protein
MRHVLCLIGEDLFANSNIGLFVDGMFRIVGLDPDPPNEFYWDSSMHACKAVRQASKQFLV